MKDLKADLRQRQQDHLYRQRRISSTACGPRMHIDGRELVNFCSNDYLGLAAHPAVKQALVDAVDHYGVGSGAAHLVSGHYDIHERLEQALAEFTGYPRALLFSTGYMANIGIAQALLARGELVFEDRLNHASLLDAGLVSGARFSRYRHNDSKDLDSRLLAQDARHSLVMTDAVFSMDGDLAELPALQAVCRRHRALLMIDDAHGIGVLGEQGRGSLSQHGLDAADDLIYMATLGKALGTSGAFVAASDDIIETLIQKARSYIYTTAAPPALAAATLQSLAILQQEDRQQRLHSNIAYFRQCSQQQALPLSDSMTAIQPIITGASERALAISACLFEKGLYVTAIRPPTVPADTARLRITLSASHSRSQIDQLLEGLADCMQTE